MERELEAGIRIRRDNKNKKKDTQESPIGSSSPAVCQRVGQQQPCNRLQPDGLSVLSSTSSWSSSSFTTAWHPHRQQRARVVIRESDMRDSGVWGVEMVVFRNQDGGACGREG